MDEKELLETIEQAARENETFLDLSGGGLTSLPPEIGRLTNLRRLYLHHNQLTSVPAELAQLTKLTDLSLGANRLTSVPAELAQLANLTQLDLGENQLTSVPGKLGQLANLRVLYLLNNQLTSVPAKLARLTNLTRLDLDNNQLTSVPAGLAQLKNLTALRLNGNQLTSVPGKLGQLANLRVLCLHNNQLTSVPAELAQLTNLTELLFSENQLTSVPGELGQLANLTILDLSRNQLTSLPAELRHLTNLRTLRFDGNLMESPPAELVAQGTQAILNYFCELGVRESDYLYEAKLLLVGEERAGKSSLAKALTDPGYSFGDSDSTHGIDIIRWMIPKEETGLPRDFRLNIWDFGGQEIYHSTHQFFLTKRSIYFLVAEVRKDVRHEDFYYWLNIIELLGGHSPIVILQNKCDQPGVGLAIREYQDQFAHIVESPRNVSCKEAYRATIEDLREATKRIITSKELLPDVGAKLPKVWVDIREELETLRTNGRNYISYNKYLGICSSFEMDEKRAIFLSDYFHDLGVFLHFRDDLQLTKTIFLNFEWVTKAVYNVLDNDKIIAQHGGFDTSDLEHIWHEEQFRDKQGELLSLMRNEKFELCFDLGGGRYLAPKLLPEDVPENLHGFQAHSELNEPLLHEYSYEFMPKGILTRLIVRLNKHIHRNTYWRYGVLLEFDNTRALVRERYFGRKITTVLEGENKKELLGVIRQNIEDINGTFTNLQVREMIPCNCAKCSGSDSPYYYELDRLRKRLREGKKTVECDESYEKLSVNKILGNVVDDLMPRKWASSETCRFRVALSFPGEQREFVHEVAGFLGEAFGEDEVFYDEHFEGELARPDLDMYLLKIYHNDSELIVVFLCAGYEEKEWCGLEWRAIRDLIKKGKASAIMLVRFDDTDIPGLFSIHGYVDARDRTAREVAELVIERCRINQQNEDR